MAKRYLKTGRMRKSAIALLAAAAITCTGLAAACSKKDNEDEKDALAKKQEDTQLLKNGNFEFFDYPSDENVKDGKAVYLIKNPDNWTRGGDSSNAMSGIIGTSEEQWKALTADDLADKLDYNNDLSSSDEKYVNYNGMKSRDILYKDTYAALLSSGDVAESYIKNQSYETYFGIEERDGKYYIGDKEVFKKAPAEDGEESEKEDVDYYFDAEYTKSVRKQLIENPGTHFTVESDGNGGYFYKDGGKTVTVYKGEDGNFYYDKELKFPCTNVLMVHNYPTASTYNGIWQYYSSESIKLEANTAAEISLWVKTSDLKFDKGYSQLDEQDRGAFIEVVQSVGETSIDSFIIKAINTEKIIAGNKNNPAVTDNESNGWLKYTIYVNACDFADSTISLRLGLGQDEPYEKCTGYAFFDDVTVTKYLSLDGEGCTYKANESKVVTRTLADEDKVLYADKEVRNGDSDRFSQNFHYLDDLASSPVTGSQGYSPVKFGDDDNTTVGLTSEKKNDVWYASAKDLGEATVLAVNADTATYELPKTLKEEIITDGDLLGAFKANETAFAGSAYAAKLTAALSGDCGIDKLPGYSDGHNMLVMLSKYGAPYTATVKDAAFALDDGQYMIVSLWVKTSDMNGKTAATLRIYELDEDGKKIDKTVQGFDLDTTGVKTEFEDNKDMYNGWVQCFIFVENNSGDSKTFALDFLFGNTAVYNTTTSDYNYGWAAFANLQTMTFEDEDIYGLGTDASGHLIKFSFEETEDENGGNAFDTASGTSDITQGFAKPSSYTGVNGGSSSVGGTVGGYNYDGTNTHAQAGLINRDETDAEKIDDILGYFASTTDAVKSWNDVFGDKCYQPLIIVNNVRDYADKQTATAETYKKYFVECDANDAGYAFTDVFGKSYRQVADGEAFSESTTYYSKAQVANYGYVGNGATVAAEGYATVSVRVKVSAGATAYVYLVNSDTREVLGYSVPEYTFNYDEEGNVLNTEYSSDMKDSDHKAAVVYTLRKDGLYDGKDGVYANTYNLVKSYKYYKFERYKFFKDDAHTQEISFDDLVDGETYYYEDGTVASHFLCNTDGKRVYEYDGASKTYYYLVDGKRGTEVKPFDKTLARYTDGGNADMKYAVKVEAKDTEGDKWQTVNFFIHAGNEAIDYRLELWCGERDKQGTLTDVSGAVAFDYSAYTVDENNYATMLGKYEKDIIELYQDLLIDNNLFDRVDSKNENIAYYQKLVAELKESGELTADVSGLDFLAKYYTYTLYDSEAFVPFNEETAADGETGYDYKITDNEEVLAFFKYLNEEENSVNVFADYSAVKQKVEMTTADGNDDGADDDSDKKSNDAWLLISSIVLVVALVFALVSLLLRDLWKKRRAKNGDKTQKNKSNKKRKRYIRKLHLVENAEPVDEPVEEAVDEVAEEPVEEAVEEATAEETVGTEATAEETVEDTAETEPTEEQPNDENKE